jgi:hypothetical protein
MGFLVKAVVVFLVVMAGIAIMGRGLAPAGKDDLCLIRFF